MYVFLWLKIILQSSKQKEGYLVIGQLSCPKSWNGVTAKHSPTCMLFEALCNIAFALFPTFSGL